MPRSMWVGSISFGLVNVPVKMYTATAEKKVQFKQVNSKTGGLVKQKRVDAGTGDEVQFEDIVKGYELSKDRYVIVTGDELDSVMPTKSSTIDIEEFVDIGDIDPMAYSGHHYLEANTGGDKAYRLLVVAMLATGKVGIGRVVMRNKERLVAIRALPSGALVCSSLVWWDEINPSEQFSSDAEVSERELQMAAQLVGNLAGKFDHDKFSDTYRTQLMNLIEAKASGEIVATPTPEAPAEDTGNLMDALEASLQDLTKTEETETAAAAA